MEEIRRWVFVLPTRLFRCSLENFIYIIFRTSLIEKSTVCTIYISERWRYIRPNEVIMSGIDCKRTLTQSRGSLSLIVEKQSPKRPRKPFRVRPGVQEVHEDLLAGDAVDDVEDRLGGDGLVDAEAGEDPLDRGQHVLFPAQVHGTLGERGVHKLESCRNVGSGLGGGGGLVNP